MVTASRGRKDPWQCGIIATLAWGHFLLVLRTIDQSLPGETTGLTTQVGTAAEGGSKEEGEDNANHKDGYTKLKHFVHEQTSG